MFLLICFSCFYSAISVRIFGLAGSLEKIQRSFCFCILTPYFSSMGFSCSRSCFDRIAFMTISHSSLEDFSFRKMAKSILRVGPHSFKIVFRIAIASSRFTLFPRV